MVARDKKKKKRKKKVVVERIAVLCSGGDASGMNVAVRAIVRAAYQAGIQEVWGVYGGYDGLIDGKMELLRSDEHVVNILSKGGTILRSARSDRFRKSEFRERAFDRLDARNIDALIVIGGDGSLKGAKVFANEYGEKIQVVGIPASIDNDLAQTKMSIGADTGLNVAIEAIDKVRDTAYAHQRAFLIQVMGRDCHFLPVMIGLASGAHSVLLPEEDVDLVGLAELIMRGFDMDKPYVIIIVSEGIRRVVGNKVSPQLEWAPISMVYEELNRVLDNDPRYQNCRGRVRPVILGHVQRGGSPTQYDRILATRFGVATVDAILRGETSVMTVLQGGDVVRTIPIKDPIPMRKRVPDEYYDLLTRVIRR